MIKIVTISGQARNGKDTFGEFLKDKLEKEYNKKVFVLHYADFVKFITTKWYGWDGQKDEKGRTLLQYLGTDVFRKNHPDCWVNIAKEIILGLGDTIDVVLIPDTRFPNEIELMKELDGYECICVEVIRDNFDNGLTEQQKSHYSEVALLGYKFDKSIHNNQGLKELEEEAEKFAKELNV